jgi:hypothetical protein
LERTKAFIAAPAASACSTAAAKPGRMKVSASSKAQSR